MRAGWVRRSLAIVIALGTGILIGGLVIPASNGQAATLKVYSLTVAGTDVHSLNPSWLPAFVDGGGVQAVNNGAGYQGNTYFEASLDLPVGAKVTSVAISYKTGDFPRATSQFAFGSYSPSTRGTQQAFTVTAPVTGTPSTYTKSGNPLVTTVSGRRYVLDWLFEGTASSPSSDLDTFYGATVKYTCTAPCVP
jgi:hypothetical protein